MRIGFADEFAVRQILECHGFSCLFMEKIDDHQLLVVHR